MTNVLTGRKFESKLFRAIEYNSYDFDAVLDVLEGRLPLVVFRNVIDKAVCKDILERFWKHPEKQTRGKEAPGFYMGGFTWCKTTAEYLDQCEALTPGLDEVLNIPEDPIARFFDGLATKLDERGAMIRRATKDGRMASPALMRSWHGSGKFALAPHDDDSQCSDPRMADYERNLVVGNAVGALNMCLENDPKDGKLHIWNIMPDSKSKRALDLEITGSPYPMESLEGIESIQLEIRTGDVYVFDGTLVHAVEPNNDPNVRRTTLASMIAFTDDKTVVSWS